MENFTTGPSCWKRWKILEVVPASAAAGKNWEPMQLLEKLEENGSPGRKWKNWEKLGIRRQKIWK